MKIIKVTGKIILAGVVALVILSAILCLYSLTPVHIENTAGNTDYVWPANARWVKMTEGISFGKYDANGFNNKTVVENPDIIILGSSHMEATNVMQDENVGYILNEKLDGKHTVYNMGVSGHSFFKICQYLPTNLELYYTAPKVVIIETSEVNISETSVDQVLQGSVAHTPSYSTGLIGTLQKVPFLRLIYQQVEGGLTDIFMPDRTTKTVYTEDADTEDLKTAATIDQNSYNKLFDYLASLEEKYGTEIIIFYHPTEKIKEDGTVEFKDSEFLTAFTNTAEQNGITFIDMTRSFENMFYEEHHVAHGFVTGKLGSGHLNAYGHAAVADSLFDAITGLEEDGKLCK